MPRFWTFFDVGFQNQGESLACMLCCLCATESPDSPLVRDLLTSRWPTWQPSCFNPHTYEQALVGARVWDLTHSVRQDRYSTKWTQQSEVTLRIMAQVSGVSVALKGDFKDNCTGLRGSLALRGDFKDHRTGLRGSLALRGDFKDHRTCLRNECSTQGWL